MHTHCNILLLVPGNFQEFMIEKKSSTPPIGMPIFHCPGRAFLLSEFVKLHKPSATGRQFFFFVPLLDRSCPGVRSTAAMENDVPITTIMDLVEDDLYNPLAIDLPGTVRHFQSSILAENQLLDTKILEQYACNPENVAKSAVLDKLSQCLLAPPYTLPMIKLFRPIVIDLVARWLLPGLTSFLETDNNNAIQKIELVAKAFSVILPVVPQVKM